MPLAAMTIKNRLIDFRRRERRHAEVSSLDERRPSADEEDDRPLIESLASERDEIEEREMRRASRTEISEFSAKLEGFGVSLYDVAENCPRQQRTLEACRLALAHARRHADLLDRLERTGKLPITELSAVPVSRAQDARAPSPLSWRFCSPTPTDMKSSEDTCEDRCADGEVTIDDLLSSWNARLAMPLRSTRTVASSRSQTWVTRWGRGWMTSWCLRVVHGEAEVLPFGGIGQKGRAGRLALRCCGGVPRHGGGLRCRCLATPHGHGLHAINPEVSMEVNRLDRVVSLEGENEGRRGARRGVWILRQDGR